MVAVPAVATAAAPAANAANPQWVGVAGLATALPPHPVTSEALTAALPRVWPRLEGRIGPLLRELNGGERHYVRTLDEMTAGLPLGEQTRRYAADALALAETAARGALAQAGCATADVGLIVVSSCTGLVLPGLDVRLVWKLGLHADVVRMPLTLFGCAGGAVGLARAAEWVRAHPSRAALVVAVELPSLTFRPSDTSVDNLLSALVFGDGAGAAVLRLGISAGDGAAACSAAPASVAIGHTHSVLVAGTADDLGYQLADDGFKVILSRRLPDMIEQALPGLVADFMADTLPRSLAVVAAHPGGPGILTAVQRALCLADEQLAASRGAFMRTGNTSSAALFFVLEEQRSLMADPPGAGLAIAFGPGLTVELLQLRWDA